jgi:serine/threonine-protein kinase
VAASSSLWRATSPVEHPVVRIGTELVVGDAPFTYRLSENTSLSAYYPGTILVLSADGTRLAAAIRDSDGTSQLAIRRTNESRFVPLPGTERAGAPFFSPDGHWLAFFAGRTLKKIPVEGGASIPLSEAGNFASGSWGDNDHIVAALNQGRGGMPQSALSSVSVEGGNPTPVTELRSGERSHRWPQVLPGSEAVLFTVYHSESPDDATVEALVLKTHERKVLVHGAVMGQFMARSSSSGYLVFLHQNTLLAAPFDLGKLALRGSPQPVLDDVSAIGGDIVPGEFHFSPTGLFIYVSGKVNREQSIFWLDSSGNTQALRAQPGYYSSMRFSPDGKRLAFAQGPGYAQQDIWVQDIERDVSVRLTPSPGAHSHPVWTPDGNHIVFVSGGPNASLNWVRADGSGQPQPLAVGEYSFPLAFSSDRKQMGFMRGTARIEGDDGDHPRLDKLQPFQADSRIALPAFSPDFSWVAYDSDETGRPEVYVRPFPGLAAKRVPISTGGGTFPVWSSEGHELFFLGPDQRIMVVDYTVTAESFRPGKPRVWSEKQVLRNLGGGPVWPYGLAPDGKRFAVLLYPDGTAETKPTAQLTYLTNFVDYLRQRVSPGK